MRNSFIRIVLITSNGTYLKLIIFLFKERLVIHSIVEDIKRKVCLGGMMCLLQKKINSPVLVEGHTRTSAKNQQCNYCTLQVRHEIVVIPSLLYVED